MILEEILASNNDKEKIKARIKGEGRLVLQTIQTPGWSLIEGCLLAAKINAEKERKKALPKNPTGELALYYSGIVDGIEEAKQEIFNVIKMAQKIEDDEAGEGKDG